MTSSIKELAGPVAEITDEEAALATIAVPDGFRRGRKGKR